MTTKQPKMILAIDPGMAGAIAVLCRQKISTFPLKNKTDEEIVLFFEQFEPSECVAYMERVGGYVPKGDGEGQPGSRMFNFGQAYGFVRGILKTRSIPLKLVLPQVWQRGISGGRRTYSERKKLLHAHARRLFPDLQFSKEEADALGILHYARFVELGQNAGYDPADVRNASCAASWAMSQGWQVPAEGTPEFASMVEYWKTHISRAKVA